MLERTHRTSPVLVAEKHVVLGCWFRFLNWAKRNGVDAVEVKAAENLKTKSLKGARPLTSHWRSPLAM